MKLIERFNNQIILWKQNLDFAPWERWSVYMEDDRNHFVSGNFHFSLTKIGAWLWGFFNVRNKRKWKLIKQKHTYF